jgi:hypothetical protein
MRALILKDIHTPNQCLHPKAPVVVLGFEINIKAHRSLYTPWTRPKICDVAEVRHSNHIVSMYEKGFL